MLTTKVFTNFLFGILLFFSLSWQCTAGDIAPAFDLPSEVVSEDGHIKLSWNISEPAAVVEVQQSGASDFHQAKIIYKGPDNATFVSGLKDGEYYYRVRHQGGNWSDSIQVSVQHHSLSLAFTLLGLGAFVFFLTVFVVIKGALQTTVD